MHYAPYSLSISVRADDQSHGSTYRLSSKYDDIKAAKLDASELYTMISDANTIGLVDVFGELVDIYDNHGWQSEAVYDMELV